MREINQAAYVRFAPDARQGDLKSIEITLSAMPGTVTTVALPDDAIGFRLHPHSNNCRFALGEDPAAVAASSATSISAGSLAVGGIARADAWETRLIERGQGRTLRLRSTTASLVVDLEVF